MLEEIQGFSQVEYLVAFQSIILGFIASEYFSGWGNMLRRRREIDYSLIFTLFSVLTFFVLLVHWWNLWYRAELLKNSIFQFVKSIPYFIFYYMLVLYLFRNQKRIEKFDLYDYFLRYRVRLYVILGLYFLYDQLISISNDDYFFTVSGLILCVTGIISASKIVQLSIQILGLILAVTYTLLDSYGIVIFDSIGQLEHSYSRIEHITIFISLLYGYVITEFFNGWAKLFQKIRLEWDVLFYWAWTLFAFLLLIEKWWSTWSSPLLSNPSILNYLVILVNSFNLYLISVVLFPRVLMQQNLPVFEYFLSVKKYLYGLFTTYFALNLLVDLTIKEIDYFVTVNYFRIIAIVLSGFGLIFLHRAFHHTLVAISLVLVTLYFLRLSGFIQFQ